MGNSIFPRSFASLHLLRDVETALAAESDTADTATSGQPAVLQAIAKELRFIHESLVWLNIAMLMLCLIVPVMLYFMFVMWWRMPGA